MKPSETLSNRLSHIASEIEDKLAIIENFEANGGDLKEALERAEAVDKFVDQHDCDLDLAGRELVRLNRFEDDYGTLTSAKVRLDQLAEFEENYGTLANTILVLDQLAIIEDRFGSIEELVKLVNPSSKVQPKIRKAALPRKMTSTFKRRQQGLQGWTGCLSCPT